MKRISFKPVILGLLVLGLGALASCDKDDNTIIVECPGCDQNPNPQDSTNKSRINFTGSIESIRQTKSVSAFPTGRYVTAYAYQPNETNPTNPSNFVIYKSLSPGALTPTNNMYMWLLAGTYNFFAVSTDDAWNENPNISDTPPTPLVNDRDYLWAQNKSILVDIPVITVPLTFEHCCAQIVVKVMAGVNVYINSIESMQVTPPTPGNSLDVFTGKITPATTLSSTMMNMHVNKDVAQLIVLPLQSADSMKLSMDLFVNYIPEKRTFATKIPVPQGGLTGGNSYLFEAVISNDTVQFSQTNIINWVDIDENKKPLYPSQIQ